MTRAIPRSRSEPTRSTASSRFCVPAGLISAARDAGDLLAGSVPIFIPFVEAGQRIGHHLGRRVRLVQQLQQREHDELVAQPAERLRHRRAQQLVVEQGHQPWGDARIPQPRQRLDRRKRQEEIAALGDLRQPLHRVAGMERPERFDGMKPDVDVGIVECADQRRHGAAVTAFAEDQGGLDPQVDVVAGQAADERIDHIDVGHRQQIQHAAEDAEVAMLLAQRTHQRVHDRRPLPGEPADGALTISPLVRAEITGQRR